MTISESQLITMLELQDGMNGKVNSDWVAASNNLAKVAVAKVPESTLF
jgi:hypothetical protein